MLLAERERSRTDFLMEEIERFTRQFVTAIVAIGERSTAHAAISTGGGN